MGRIVSCYLKDIPANAKILDDVKTKDGVLLCKKDATINDGVRKLLKNYRGKIRVELDEDPRIKEIQDTYHLSDEIMNHISPSEIQDEHSFELAEDVKEEALNGITSIYNNKDNPDEVSSLANELSTKILDNILNSDSVNINLNKLKICDEYTYKHSIDVATMAVLIARELGYDDKFQHEIITSGVLHDLGKVDIPNEILNKAGRLTNTEFEYIQKHPITGYEIVKDCKDISENVKLGILGHHEGVDGSGYPAHLEGDAIAPIAKILAIADVYDALVTTRPYRQAMLPSDALEIMFTMSNKFDPIIFRAFLRIIVAYPVGSVVMTSIGDSCIVLDQNVGYPLRPVIKNLSTDEVIDLAHDYNSMSIIITGFIE